MIRISCRFEASLGRITPHDYLRALDLSVMGYDMYGRQFLLGKIAGDLLLFSDAEADEEDLFEICDADSEGAAELYRALFAGGSEFQDELGMDEVTEYIIFLWRAVFHPKLKPYQQAIIQTISELFGGSSLVVMWRNLTALTDKQLAALGFSKIAQNELVFRHVCRRSKFTGRHSRGVDAWLNFNPSEKHEEWVKEKWGND